MMVAALLVIPVIAIEESTAGDGWRSAAAALNWLIWIAFAVEAGLMLSLVDDRLGWIRSHPLEVAIVLLTPPVLPASLQALRVFRLLRLLRLLRVAKLARSFFSLNGLRYAAFVVVLTAVAAGAAYSSLEEGRSTWDGVWWSVTTMTTVGYGDISPVTVGGRLLAMGVMLVGIGFIAVLTGAIAERFLASEIERSQGEVVVEVEESGAELHEELRAIRERLQVLEERLRTRSGG